MNFKPKQHLDVNAPSVSQSGLWLTSQFRFFIFTYIYITDTYRISMNQTTETKKIDLCPICKNGTICEDLFAHGKNWNTTGGRK